MFSCFFSVCYLLLCPVDSVCLSSFIDYFLLDVPSYLVDKE